MVSLIIVCRNFGKLLENAIRSVMASSYSAYKLIVIDNNSSDNTFSMARALNTSTNSIKCIRLSKENDKTAYPLGYCRQVGLDAVETEEFAFLDADDLIHPDFNRIMHDIIATHPNCKLAISNYIEFKDKLNEKNDSESNIFAEDLFKQAKYSSEEVKESIKISNKIGFIKSFFAKNNRISTPYLYNKVFSTNFVRVNNIKFNTDSNYSEDRLFVFDYISKLSDDDEIIYTSLPTYAKRIHNKSMHHNRLNVVNAEFFNSYSLNEEIVIKQLIKQISLMNDDILLAECKFHFLPKLALNYKQAKQLNMKEKAEDYKLTYKQYCKEISKTKHISSSIKSKVLTRLALYPIKLY